MSGLNDTGTIDLPSDNSRNSGRQVNASVYTLAAVFGAVTLPDGMPDYLKEHIEREANFAQMLDTAGLTIGGFGGGPLDQKTKEERQQEHDDEAGAQLAATFEEIEHQREREEWSHTLSTVGGVEMTGAEWRTLAQRLRDDQDLHRRLIEAFEKRGMTEAEAETRYERVADVAEIAAIPPGQRTEEQTAAFEKANADPSFNADMADAKAANVIPRLEDRPLRACQQRQALIQDGKKIGVCHADRASH